MQILPSLLPAAAPLAGYDTFLQSGGGSGVGWGGGLWLYLVRLLCTEMVPVRSLVELRKYALSLLGF